MNYFIALVSLVLGILSIKKLDSYINEDRENRNFKNSENFNIGILGVIPLLIAMFGSMFAFVENLKLLENGWSLVLAAILLIIFGLYQSILNFKAAKKARENNNDLDVIKFNYFTRKTWIVSHYETTLGWGLSLLTFADILLVNSVSQPSVRNALRMPFIILVILTALIAIYLPKYITRWLANKAINSKENKK